MNVRIWSEEKYQKFGRRPRALILIMGVLLVILGTTYIGLLPGWSAGIALESVSQPAMLVAASDAWFLVDSHGIVRGAISNERPQMFPKIHGIDSQALLRQEFSAVDAVQNGYELATLLFENDNHQLRERDLLINFSDPQNIVATLSGVTIHFGNRGFQEKWDRVMYVRDTHAIGLLVGTEWDLRFPNTVIVRGSE